METTASMEFLKRDSNNIVFKTTDGTAQIKYVVALGILANKYHIIRISE